jgi:hypothetical protein
MRIIIDVVVVPLRPARQRKEELGRSCQGRRSVLFVLLLEKCHFVLLLQEQRKKKRRRKRRKRRSFCVFLGWAQVLQRGQRSHWSSFQRMIWGWSLQVLRQIRHQDSHQMRYFQWKAQGD